MKNLAFLLFAFSFLSFTFEGYSGKRISIIKQVRSIFTKIDANEIPSTLKNGDFIYFNTNNVSYNLIEDPEFNITQTCGELRREVQYCMWNQYIKVTRSGSSVKKDYSYHKIWSATPIKSRRFRNSKIKNPTVDEIADMKFHNNMTAGLLNITNALHFIGPNTVFQPDSEELAHFSSSSHAERFNYTKNGIFYSEFKNGTLKSLINSNYFSDFSSDTYNSWCEPGDRRMRFTTWAPKYVTVVGKFFNNTVIPGEFKEFKIGSVFSGYVTLEQALSVNYSIIPTIIKWMFRFVFLGFISYCIVKKISINVTSLGIYILGMVISHPSLNNDYYRNKDITIICLISFLVSIPISYFYFIEKDSEI
ncbi:hypothetical protein TVAG_395070 [Trichomonas vaginalis G3]|uniref:Uncharacterized protein n=1 Tax=Trichomonas vaginalis (strain ATCC PRA-98 / G3) TaxID=412133 RepID=A2EDH1_TRIV3|nr:hypothetical protein TVAGG3_0724480 [Trichomonas vaginalis G3]EAY09335.1 hypothetical protein TVAG_395070 [Trichomonas vaginalis G3]KAI5510809.1 hypothetical protein TVAGG3_0724480 [Trichomonas vaginalis G3]|eukprot:XP_001321558.1 hypothetical protein [Trichomonas vaginalis G3]